MRAYLRRYVRDLLLLLRWVGIKVGVRVDLLACHDATERRAVKIAYAKLYRRLKADAVSAVLDN